MLGEFDDDGEAIGLGDHELEDGDDDAGSPSKAKNVGRGGQRKGTGKGRASANKRAAAKAGAGRRVSRDYSGWEEWLFEDEDADNAGDVRRAKNRMRKDQLKVEHTSKKGKKPLWLVYLCLRCGLCRCLCARIAFFFLQCVMLSQVLLRRDEATRPCALRF